MDRYKSVLEAERTIPRAFLERRLQSITGLFLVLFLIEHLFTNSLSAFLADDDAKNFISLVNTFRSLPYVQVIEVLLIGLPFVLHAWLGILRIHTTQINAVPSDGSQPFLPYSRNIFYTVQVVTGIVLIAAVTWHVVSMRFINAPKEIGSHFHTRYAVSVTADPALDAIAERLHVTLHTEPEALQEGRVIAVADNEGTAMLLMVRDTFKSPLMCILYSCFVLFAAFHAANGFWTFCITWGIALNEKARLYVRYATSGLGVLLLLFGLASIWGTYWVNLYG